MKKPLLLALLIGTAALSAQATDININLGNMRVNVPGTGVTVTFGSRNESGHYWDGQEWRNEKYWREHHGPRGEKHYTGHAKQGRHEREHEREGEGERHRHHDDEHRGHCPPRTGQKRKLLIPSPSTWPLRHPRRNRLPVRQSCMGSR